MRKLILALLILLAMWPKQVLAVADPRNSPNNVFGIHIIDANDLEDAARLVNSSGGEWGWVTVVIREDDRDLAKWQKIFDRMRSLKLIPIVRLATKPIGQNWEAPKEDEIPGWMDFLSSLKWVVKNRYIILFNEPNYASEWGGRLDPSGYARIVRLYHDRLKSRSEDFFILPAGFDASAPNSAQTMDVVLYWKLMHRADPNIFSLFDGWTSHSYPNPGFASSPVSGGRGSIRSFEWETSFLSELGLRHDLPIFITETGWIHKEGLVSRVLGYDSETVGKFFKDAYRGAWNKSRIVAVTPFVLNYQAPPFDNFSWKKDVSEYYPQFREVQAIPKLRGKPEQINKSRLLASSVPLKMISDSDYRLSVDFINEGQSIWNSSDFKLEAHINAQEIELKDIDIPITKPKEQAHIVFDLHTSQTYGKQTLTLQLKSSKELFGDIFVQEAEVVPSPSIKLQSKLLISQASGEDFRLIIYDSNNPLTSYNLKFIEGVSTIDNVRNLVPGKEYRFVLIKPGYLPRQTKSILSGDETELTFSPMLPLDFNRDGAFGIEDLVSIFHLNHLSLFKSISGCFGSTLLMARVTTSAI